MLKLEHKIPRPLRQALTFSGFSSRRFLTAASFSSDRATLRLPELPLLRLWLVPELRYFCTLRQIVLLDGTFRFGNLTLIEPKCISHSSYALCLDVIFDNKYPLFDCKLSDCKRTKFNLFLCKCVNVFVNSLQYPWGYENCMSLFNSKCNCLKSVLHIFLHRLISQGCIFFNDF